MCAVPLYGQKYSMSCWAASMRMMLANRMRMVASDDAIAAPTNDQASLRTGLNPNATQCLRHWGFRMLAPMTYTEDGFASLFARCGPLWVACDVRFPGASRACPHIRVVTGVRTMQSPMMIMSVSGILRKFGSPYGVLPIGISRVRVSTSLFHMPTGSGSSQDG